MVLKLLDALAYAPLDDSLGDQELLRLGRTRADFGLESPRLAVRIRAGASEAAISFGSPTPSASGVYAAIDDVRAVFVVPSNTFAAVDVPASGFRRRTLFTSGEESVASFDVKRGAGEFMRFRREGDGWLMVQPTEGPASLTKIKKLLSDVMSASAVDFVWPVGGSNEVAEASDALLAGYGLGAEKLEVSRIDARINGLLVHEALEVILSHTLDDPEWQLAPDNREGVRISFDLDGGVDNAWFLLRLSVHDPVMPLNAESDVKGGVQFMLKKLYELLDGTEDIELDLAPLKKLIEG